MAGYIIVDVEVQNPEAYREYTSQVPDTLAADGGEFIVRGGTVETLEGQWNLQRVVVFKFPSTEQARAYYGSPAYQAILPIRQRHAKTNFLTVLEGT